MSAGLKALRGLPAATAFLQKAIELKQTIGKLPHKSGYCRRDVPFTLSH